MPFVEQRDKAWKQVEINPMEIQRAHDLQRTKCAAVIGLTDFRRLRKLLSGTSASCQQLGRSPE
ncbi:hypothetical protein A5740_16260 [Mycobacterium sp. GA-1841]|nr:hypothetical protein A5740_16260 [Mycobacterium sp. GA-1841]